VWRVRAGGAAGAAGGGDVATFDAWSISKQRVFHITPEDPLNSMQTRTVTGADLLQVCALVESSPAHLFDNSPGAVPATVAGAISASVLESELGGLLGFCALSATPASVAAALQHELEGVVVAPGNCALLSHFVLSAALDDGVAGAAALLAHALAPLPEVRHLVVVAPAAAGISDYDTAASPLAYFGLVRAPLLLGGGTRAVYLLPRTSPPLRCRTARVEDHDVVAPIFQGLSEVVQEAFGEFYLAEMIEAAERDPTQRILVAERGGAVCGLLAARAAPDTATIARCYDLAPFNYLRRADADAGAGAPEPSALAPVRDAAEKLLEPQG